MAVSITNDLVRRAAARDRAAMDQLFTRLHAEVKKIVVSLGRRRPWTVDVTDVVDRVYERLIKQRDPKWTDRTHFLRFVVLIARRAIADLNPRKVATLVSSQAVADGNGISFADLDECIRRLELRGKSGPRIAEVVLLRCFTDLQWPEIADVLHVSERTVKGDWSFAQAFLRAKLSPTE